MYTVWKSVAIEPLCVCQPCLSVYTEISPPVVSFPDQKFSMSVCPVASSKISARPGTNFNWSLIIKPIRLNYRIAGNFRGRKLSWIGEKYDFRGENFHGLLACAAPKDATPPNFTEKTFTNSHKTAKFAKVFSLESFPLYGKLYLHVSASL